MNEIKLKPCPFCGKSKAKIHYPYYTDTYAAFSAMSAIASQHSSKHQKKQQKRGTGGQTMAKMKKCGKWIDVEYNVGTFNSEKTGEIELTIVHGRCSNCKSYSYNICQWSTVMMKFCPKCGFEMK